jgi:hypothetical protein
VVIPRAERHSIAASFFPKQREQEPQGRWEVFLDVRRDHAPDSGSRLDGLDALVKPREREYGPDAMLAKRPFQLVLCVNRIEWGDDGADFPRAELSDEKLRAVGEKQRNAIAALDSE